MSAASSITQAAATSSAQSTGSCSPPTAGTSTASRPANHQFADLTTESFRPDSSLQPFNKKACLHCRARKIRCDGVEPCRRKRGVECSFIPSRRGGSKPRKDRRRNAPDSSAEGAASNSNAASADGVDIFVSKLQGFMHTLLSPKASAAGPSTLAQPIPASDAESLSSISSPSASDSLRVRQYANGEQILIAYYTHIYAYEPFLPPQTLVSVSTLLSTLAPPSPTDLAHPTSPLLLAILASLVLIPAPCDPEPRSASSKAARREASARWAAEAEQRVDEMTREAGRSGGSLVPIEVIQALSMCGLYEWAQHGDVPTMRTRHSVALQFSMDAGLHCLDDERSPLSQMEPWWREMGRRTFWLAFGRVLLGTLASGLPSVIAPYDSRITVRLPECSAGADVWFDQMEALRLAVYTKDFVDSVEHVPGPAVPHAYFSSCGTTTASDRIKEYERLDRTLTCLIRESERKVAGLQTISLAQSDPLDPELLLTMNFRRSALMCRTMTFINLHRKSAFHKLGGVGVFTKRMCGLPAISDGPSMKPKRIASFATASPSSVGSADGPWSTLNLTPAAGTVPPGGFDDFLANALANWTPPVDVSPDDASDPAITSTIDTDDDCGWPDIPTWSSHGDASLVLEAPLATAFSGSESLAKVRAGVETVARLEVMHEALLLSKYGRVTTTLPFCACELVVAAYCLLVLALTLQASDTLRADRQSVRTELEGIWSSCWTILRGLRSFGDVWDGLDGFADELQAALNASLALCGLPARNWTEMAALLRSHLRRGGRRKRHDSRLSLNNGRRRKSSQRFAAKGRALGG